MSPIQGEKMPKYHNLTKFSHLWALVSTHCTNGVDERTTKFQPYWCNLSPSGG